MSPELIPQVIACQDYCELSDGRIVSVHGRQSYSDTILGQVAFVPAPDGSYSRAGQKFAKPYIHLEHSSTIGPGGVIRDLGQAGQVGKLLPHMSVVGRGRVKQYMTARESLIKARARSGQSPNVRALENIHDWILRLFGINDGRDLGLTGSLALFDLDREAHDFDVVIPGTVEEFENWFTILERRFADNPEARVFEYDKWWIVRTRTTWGIACLFFSAKDLPVNPSISSTWLPVTNLRAKVTRIVSHLTTPVILELGCPWGETSCLVYDLRVRGSFRVGQEVEITGAKDSISEGPWSGPIVIASKVSSNMW